MAGRQVLRGLLLLWLIGIALRLPILAVPPVIPALRDDFGMSGTEIGILSGLPMVMFAAAALAGSLLVARLGALSTAVVAMLLVAAASALRAVAPDVTALFVATAVTGAGVAVTQPAAAALVRRWAPQRIGLATGLYTNGLLVGEILPVALFPILIVATGGWRGSFLAWAVPVAAIAMAVFLFAPRDREQRDGPPASRVWWPDWRDPEIWRVGLVFAGSNTMYFGVNAFLPGYLAGTGRDDLISPSLTALNSGQLPASFLLIALAGRLERRAWPFVATGLLGVASIAGIVLTASGWTVAFAGLAGFAAGAAFVLGLTLPPLLSAPEDVARMSAAVFTVSYSVGVVCTVLGGMAWDLGGTAAFAFLPVAAAALPMLLLAPAIRFRRQAAMA